MSIKWYKNKPNSAPIDDTSDVILVVIDFNQPKLIPFDSFHLVKGITHYALFNMPVCCSDDGFKV